MKMILPVLLFTLASCASFDDFLKRATAQSPKRLDIEYDSISSGEQVSGKVCIDMANSDIYHLEKEFYKSKIISVAKKNNLSIADYYSDCDYVLRVVLGSETSKQTRNVPIYNYTPSKSYTAQTYSPYGTTTTTINENGGGTLNIVGQRQETEYINSNGVVLIALSKKKITELAKIKDAKIDRAAIWQITLFATSQSGDYKYVMPIMLKALDGKLKNVKTEKQIITVLDSEEQG